MCKVAGIGVWNISGLLKNFSDIPGSTGGMHGWNLVCIGDRWMHVDSSSGSCCSHNKGTSEFKGIDEFHSLIDPKKLIHSHWTEHYQFLTKEEWGERVFAIVRQAKIQNLSENQGVVCLKNGNIWKLSFVIEHDGYSILPEIYHNLQLIKCPHYFEINKGKVNLEIAFPFRGKFSIEIAIGKEESKSYCCCLKYLIIVEQEVKNKLSYPTKITAYSVSKKCRILEIQGSEREIRRNKKSKVSLDLPNCKDAFVERYKKVKKIGGGVDRREIIKPQIRLWELKSSFFCGEFLVGGDCDGVVICGKWEGDKDYIVLYDFEEIGD